MKIFAWVLTGMLAAASTLAAQDRPRILGRSRDCCPSPYSQACPPGMVPDGANPMGPPNAGDTAQPPSTNAFNEALASAGESGTQPAASYMPGFFGDLISSSIFTPVFFFDPQSQSGRTTLISSPNVTQSGGLKLAESDSPRPTNRIYYNYNFFGNVQVNVPDPTAPLMQVNRHIVGVEKTFLDGDASIGLRLPFFSFGGDPSYQTGFTGDLTILAKYALINNRRSGNLLSIGMAVTAPTGGEPHLLIAPGVRGDQIRYTSVNIEPFFGYIYSLSENLYVHGFHSVTTPTDSRDVTFMSNDVGLGYWLFRDPTAQFIQGFVPTFEVHVNTPFDHTTAVAVGDTLMQNSVNLTMGAHIVLPRSTIGGAVGVPLAYGPNRIEAVATYTLRY